jgi:hypothetical protein
MYLGHYPAKHRPLVWRFLLRLPENTREYSDLGISKSEKFVVLFFHLSDGIRLSCLVLQYLILVSNAIRRHTQQFEDTHRIYIDVL